MENLYDKVLSVKKYKLAPEQLLLENNITIEGGEIAKILATSADVDLDKTQDAVKGEVTVSGKVVLNIVYATSDGQINNQNCVSPFTYKIKNDVIDQSCKFNMRACVVGEEIGRLNGNQLKVITNINIEGVVIKNVEVNYLKDGDNGTYCKKEERSVVSHVKQVCEKFEETLETNVKNGVKKVLSTNVDLAIREWTPGLNFISVECELYAKVLYADAGETSELQTITIAKTIKQEIEAEGINKESDIDLTPFIIKDGVAVELAENGEETTIMVKAPIMICFNQYAQNNILAVRDIYSTTNTVEVFNDRFENDKNCAVEYVEGKIEGNVVLSDDNPRVDKYICTTNVRSVVSNFYVKDNVLTIEGIATANVVYLNDELGEILSVEVEMPYILDKKVDFDDGVMLEPVVCLADVDVMVKRGREIYFDAKAKAYVNITQTTTFEVITKLETTGTLEQKDSAIEIYFAKAGESIWDIAKSLKIPSEMICNQNPDLTDPLEKDQNIAVYYQKDRAKNV